MGSSEPDGFVVTLLISAGPPYCSNCLIRPGPMPSVIGETFNQAVTTLAEDGLSVKGSTDQPSPAPAGQVIESSPRAGVDATIPGAPAHH